MCNKFLGSDYLLGENVGFLDHVNDRNEAMWVGSADVDSHKNLSLQICVELARECAHQA